MRNSNIINQLNKDNSELFIFNLSITKINNLMFTWKMILTVLEGSVLLSHPMCYMKVDNKH